MRKTHKKINAEHIIGLLLFVALVCMGASMLFLEWFNKLLKILE